MIRISCRVSVILIIMVVSAWGDSFTFDFLHPQATGSSFQNAITLDRLGAVRDRSGVPIGFTHITSGDENLDGKASGVQLLADGLHFQASPGTLNGDSLYSTVLGVPFPTDGNGQVSIIARYASVQWINQVYEQTGIGIGSPSSGEVNSMLFGIIFNRGGSNSPTYLARWQDDLNSERGGLNPLNPWFNTSPADLSISLSAPAAANSIASFAFQSSQAGNFSTTITDHSPPLLGQSSSYAYWVFDSASGLDGMSGVLTSISFSGPNLSIPQAAVPEPSSFALLAIGLWCGIHSARGRTTKRSQGLSSKCGASGATFRVAGQPL